MVVQELIAKLGFDVDQGGLNSVDNALGNFAKKLTLAAAGIYAIKKAVDATVWAISGSINAAAQKEDVTTQFKVMLGDLEAAKFLYQEINAYAAVSPFETAGLADNVRTMMSFGQTAKDAFNDIKMLGDVALGDQTKLNRLALVYAQTFSAKKLTGGDLLQYVNAGFNPLEMISKRTHKSIADLRKDMEKGLISFDMVRQAYVDATSEGGKFYKGAEEGSKTWNGMLSTLRDNIRMLGAEMGEGVLPFLKDVLLSFFDLWPSIAGSFRTMMEAWGLLLDDGPEATTWAAMLATIFQTIADAFTLAATTFQFFVAVFHSGAQGVAVILGAIIDAILFFPKLFLEGIWAAARAVLWLGEMAAKVLPDGTINVKSIQEMKQGADQFEANWVGDGAEYTKRGYNNGADDTRAAWGKFIDLGQMIGKETEGAGPMKRSKKIDDILAGKASGQPVTINNNNQTNNLTINAEDPLKSTAEAASSKFFQTAFLQFRHAAV